jgi:hypothetical protein
VAVGLTTLVAGGEPPPDRSRSLAGALHEINRRPWVMLLVLAAVSVILLPLLEVEGADDDGALYAHRIFGHFATALRTSSWVPALVALGFTTAFLHYWLDRAVYRFSNRRTREAARGLLVGAVLVGALLVGARDAERAASSLESSWPPCELRGWRSRGPGESVREGGSA